MVSPEDSSGTSDPSPAEMPVDAVQDEKSGSTPSPTSNKRPVQVRGEYPVRLTTYYQFSKSDIRTIGVAQAASTILVALGTFALSFYLEFSKEIAAIIEAENTPDKLLQNISDICFWAWIIFWVLAFIAFLWQGGELRRIKEEHGEPTLSSRISAFWRKNGDR